jgi:hypothetical protein
VLRDLIGLSVDVPEGVLRLEPLPSAPAGAVRVRGLGVGGGLLDVDVDSEGAVLHSRTTSGLRTETAGGQLVPRPG